MSQTVGLIGIGTMGTCYAANLMRAGFAVAGYDTDGERMGAFTTAGGTPAASAGAVAAAAPTVITSMPTAAALDTICAGADGLAAAGAKRLVVALPDKQRNHDTLAAAGAVMLDCPVSGTGAQAVTGDLTVFGSGDADAFDACGPVFDAFSRARRYVGPFGHGSRMKFVANLAVAIHNVASAELMVLGMKAGLDARLLYDVIGESAATSRIFQIRGPMMVADTYRPASATNTVFLKDIGIIDTFARSLDCPTPLFSVCAALYEQAMEQGLADADSAAICRVLEQMAGPGTTLRRCPVMLCPTVPA